jgi:hypothetical protein
LFDPRTELRAFSLTRKEIRGWSASIPSVDPGDVVHLEKPQPSRTEDQGTQNSRSKAGPPGHCPASTSLSDWSSAATTRDYNFQGTCSRLLKMPIRYRRLVTPLALAALSLCVPFTNAQQPHPRPIVFPEHSRVVSPNGRYVLIDVDADTEPNHTVFLEDLRLKARRRLFNYDRHIDLSWNPDSQSLAVSDYAGSDYSRCRIYSVSENVPPVQVWDELVKAATAKEKKSLLQNDHVYIAASDWISPRVLKVKVWGHGEVNPAGFTSFYRYEIGVGIRRQQ